MLIAGVERRPIIELAYSSGADPQVPVRTDEKSWNELTETMMTTAQLGRAEIRVTAVGLLVGPLVQRANGEVAAGTFGNQGVYAGQLIVKRIERIEVLNTPTYDYRDMLRRPVF